MDQPAQAGADVSLDVYLDVVKCSHCGESERVFSANVTHNLNAMAEEAGLYKHLWRPEEIGIEFAHQLSEPLRGALLLLAAEPERFQKHNPPNGWGNYTIFREFVEDYLAATLTHPDAIVSVSR